MSDIPKRSNADKQKRFRDRQREAGKKQVRGYVTPEALYCYKEIQAKTHWNDSDVLSNSLRLMYAAYRCGQIKLLNEWLKDHEL